MENTRENTPFGKLLRPVLFYQGSETGFTQGIEKQTAGETRLHKPVFLGPGKGLPIVLGQHTREVV